MPTLSFIELQTPLMDDCTLFFYNLLFVSFFRAANCFFSFSCVCFKAQVINQADYSVLPINQHWSICTRRINLRRGFSVALLPCVGAQPQTHTDKKVLHPSHPLKPIQLKQRTTTRREKQHYSKINHAML